MLRTFGIIIAVAIVLLSTVPEAEAKRFGGSSFSSSRSYTSSSRSYSKPKYVAPKNGTYKAPVKVEKKTTVVKKTTIIQNNNSSSSGGGLGSTILGSAVGSMAGSYIGTSMALPDEPVQQAQEAVQQVVEPVKEKVEEVKSVVCPVGYACDFNKGIVLKLPDFGEA